jgi:hypothetical protein
VANDGKCVFHEEFKAVIDGLQKDVRKLNDETLTNSNKLKEYEAFKKEITKNVCEQRKELMSFLRWAVVFAFTIFVFVFGVIQWIIDKH